MIVDASALLTMLLLEPESRRRSPMQKVDAFMALSRISVQPVSLVQTRIARLACAEFGKGRHPADLTFGDRFADALAKESGQPLLFKGDNFSLTDPRPAV